MRASHAARRRQMLKLHAARRSVSIADADTSSEVMLAEGIHEDAQSLRIVCLAAADAMLREGAWTNAGISIDPNGKSVSVYTDGPAARDGFGWILKVSYDLVRGSAGKRRNLGYKFAEYIDSAIRRMTDDNPDDGSGGKFRLNTIIDRGPEWTAAVLRRIAHSLTDELPELFQYARAARGRDPAEARFMASA